MESLFTDKKAQQGIGAIGSLAIAILIGAVILGLGGTILDRIQETQTDNSASNNNETLTWGGNNTAMSLVHGRIQDSSIILYNNGTLMNKGTNYTTSGSSLTVLNSTVLFNGTPGNNHQPNQWVTDKLNVSYTYNIGSSARNTTGFGLDGVGTMAEFIPTIAIVAIAGVVIGILLLFFGRRKDQF